MCQPVGMGKGLVMVFTAVGLGGKGGLVMVG